MAGNPIRRQQEEHIASQLEELCDHLRAGLSDKQAMRALGYADAKPLYAAAKRNEALAAAVAAAREDGAHAMASSTVDIADELQLEPRAKPEAVAKLRIDSRLWLAGRRNAKYDSSSKTNVAVQVNVQALHLQALKGAALPPPAPMQVIEAEAVPVAAVGVEGIEDLL